MFKQRQISKKAATILNSLTHSHKVNPENQYYHVFQRNKIKMKVSWKVKQFCISTVFLNGQKKDFEFKPEAELWVLMTRERGRADNTLSWTMGWGHQPSPLIGQPRPHSASDWSPLTRGSGAQLAASPASAWKWKVEFVGGKDIHQDTFNLQLDETCSR